MKDWNHARRAPQHASAGHGSALGTRDAFVSYFPTGVPELNTRGPLEQTQWRAVQVQILQYIDERMDAVMEFLRIARFNLDIQKFLFRNTIAIT